MTIRLLSPVLLGLALLSMVPPSFAAQGPSLNYAFSGDKNVLGDWQMADDLASKVGSAITVEAADEGVLLKTRDSNVRLIQGKDDWTDYRVTLTGRIEYPCSFEVIGRYNALPTPSYYFLRIDSSTKQIILGRFRNLKTEVLQGTSLPPSFKLRDFELALEFDGSRIKGYLNGDLVVDQQDDGQLPSGSAGIVGSFYTNLLLKSFDVTPVQPGTSSASKPSSGAMAAASPSARQSAVVAGPDPVIPLSLKNWDLADAFKKKADLERPIL